jgi:hypothetical protein
MTYNPSIITGSGYSLGLTRDNDASRIDDKMDIQADWDDIKKKEKEKFIDAHKVKISDDDLTIFSKPKAGCRRCYGRGFKGYYSKDSTRLPLEVALCECLTNSIVVNKTFPADTNRMSYGEFKSMMAHARSIYNLEDPNEQSNEVFDGPSEEGNNKPDIRGIEATESGCN